MWDCVVCFCILLVTLPGCVYAGLSEELAETTQLCCGQGTRYARNHTSEECSSSVPPDVTPTFGSLCIFAMDQCCKEYFQKKENCEDGATIASKGNCDSASGFTKSCCTECLRGKAAGSDSWRICVCVPSEEHSPEELLAGDATRHCCKGPFQLGQIWLLAGELPLDTKKYHSPNAVRDRQRPILTQYPIYTAEPEPTHHARNTTPSKGVLSFTIVFM
ncbi:hypothetical protein evm_014553 [Chilo suppressalis]|nr:hypothetical protein evm_014553 [Chilo suppressalis]